MVPLLFKTARFKSSLIGLPPFYSMFEALDNCRKLYSLDIDWSIKPNLLTVMSLPIEEIFEVVDKDGSMNYLHNDSIKQSKTQNFLQINYKTKKLGFKERKNCRNPNVMNRIKKAVDNDQIIFKQFIDKDNVSGNINFHPFVDKMKYQNLHMLQLQNRGCRFIVMDMMHMKVGHHFNNNITKTKWKSFYQQNMHFSPRNLWYRMIHKQSSNRLALLIRRVTDMDNDRCLLCNEVEDAKYLLIGCQHKLDIWDNTFKKFLGYPITANSHQIYQSITYLNLSQYFIYNLDIKITIYDLFTSIMKMIWKYHYLQFYGNVPFDANQVCIEINTEVMRLANFKNIYV